MEPDTFVAEFESLFRLTYRLAGRRVRDKRENIAPETMALLEHMAATGPVTIGELTQHLNRAPSTLSEMVEPLIRKGLIERDRDPSDGRRFLLWLSPDGQAARHSQKAVLDPERLVRAADALPSVQRAELIAALTLLTHHLRSKGQSNDGQP